MLRLSRVPWIAAAVAVLLGAPALGAWFYADDLAFVAELDGSVPAPHPGAAWLYTFATGSTSPLIERGPYPWWTAPDLKLAFCRPVASLLLALEHRVFGHAALGWHVVSILACALAAASAAIAFRRLIPEREAILAAFVFAADGVHWMPAAWPSAQYCALASAIVFAALAMHVRARRAGARVPIVGPLLVALALSLGEIATGAFAYVIAWEWLAEGDERRRRIAALAPYAAVLVAYAVIYRALGFGVHASGGYLDPLGDFGELALVLPGRVGVLLAATFAKLPSEAAGILPVVFVPAAILGWTLLLLVVWALVRSTATWNRPERRAVVALAVGAFGAAIPGTAGFLGDRVLYVASFGAAAVVAVVLRRALASRGRFARVLGVAMIVVHLGVSPLWALASTVHYVSASRAGIELARSVPMPEGEAVRIAPIGAADPGITMYLAAAMMVVGRPRPYAFWPLTMDPHDHLVRRIDDRRLEIASIGGPMLRSAFEVVARKPSSLLHRGDVLRQTEHTVRILDDEDGAPTRIEIDFPYSLDDDLLILLAWEGGKLRRILPRIGETVRLPHEPGPTGI